MNDTLKRCLVTGLFFLSAAAYAQTPVCEWTMAGGNGTIPNGGSTGSAGNLSLTSGARLSDDVLPQNTGGNALQILGGYPTASAESAAAFDPLAGAGAFTIMGWVRRESASAGVNQSARLWSDIDTRSSRADGVEFRLSGAAGLLSLRINGQEVQSSTAGVAPDNGAWHHVAVVYDGSRAATNYNSRHVHFYIDGIQMGYGNVLSGLVVSGNTVPVTIGNSSADRSADNALVGSIDDVFVFRGWAPPPSGNGNPNPEIQSWLLLDDSTRIPGGESSDRVVPPVLLGEVQVQKIGNERLYENLKEGVIFLDGASGELYVATQDAPHGRAVCSCREWPDWHNFTNTLHINGNRIELNRFFSMQAEGNSLSIRTGTNSVFQIVGSDIGDYAPVYATPESQESYLLTANVQAEQAVLQVCTNLLEANGWRTDTVSEIIETTDASVTWRVPISAGTEPEFRRVLSASQMPAGIYAHKPLVAEQGIEMGGERWDAWPNMDAYASTGSVATVASNLSAHVSSTNNPHGITPDGIGMWNWLLARGLAFSRTISDGVGIIQGFGHYIGLEEDFWELPGDLGGDFEIISTNKTWNFRTPDRPKWNGVGLATTNGVASAVSNVDTRVDVISGIVNETTQTVASVERRVEALEYPETCVLWWTTNLASGGTYYLPTNFPTKRLEVRMNRTGLSGCTIYIDCSWVPGRDVEIDLISYAESAGTNAVRISNMKSGGVVYAGNTTGLQSRLWRVNFDKASGLWRSYFFTIDAQTGLIQSAINPSGGSPFEPTGPNTVEEWLEAMANPPAQTLSMSPPLSPNLSPLSPGVLQPAELIDLEHPDGQKEEWPEESWEEEAVVEEEMR